MLTCLEWQLLAEGNAHCVYRYGGNVSYFQGMVLKLSKVSSTENVLKRTLHQLQCFPSTFPRSASNMLDDSTDDDLLPLHSRPRSEGQSKAPLRLTSKSANNIRMANSKLCQGSRHPHVYSSLNLIHKNHLPNQCCFHTDGLHSNQADCIKAYPTLAQGELIFGGSRPRRDTRRTKMFQVTDPIPTICQIHHLSLRDNCVFSQHFIRKMPRIALLEQDLVTPPLSHKRLLSMLMSDKVKHTSHPLSEKPAWSYYTIELKLKTGLPACILDCDLQYSLLNHYNPLPDDFGAAECRKRNEAKKKPNQPNATCKESRLISSANLDVISFSGSQVKDLYRTMPNPGSKIFQFLDLAFNNVALQRLSRYALLQSFRQYHLIIAKKSRFQPEFFFSHLGDSEKTITSLEILSKYPQNNLRIFVDGTCLIWHKTKKNGVVSGHIVDRRVTMSSCDPEFSSRLQANKTNVKLRQSITIPRVHTESSTVSKPVFPEYSAWLSNNTDVKEAGLPPSKCFDHCQTPSECTINEKNHSFQKLLRALTFLSGKIITHERNLLQRLQCIHALAEAQQDVAFKLSLILKYSYIESAKVPNYVGAWKDLTDLIEAIAPARTFSENLKLLLAYKAHQHHIDTSRLIQEAITFHTRELQDEDEDFLRIALEEFFSQMEIEKRLLSQERSKKASNRDFEAEIAENIQKWHRTQGLKFCEDALIILRRNHAHELKQLLVAITKWTIRFLIGRTFLDCSVMVNIIVSYDDNLTSQDIRFFKKNRFKRYMRIPMAAINEEADLPFLDTTSDDSLMRCISLLRKIEHPVVKKYDKFGSMHNLEWIPLRELFEQASIKKLTQLAYKSAPTVSVWYRLSIVDLDLKKPKKIIEWYEQLIDLLLCKTFFAKGE